MTAVANSGPLIVLAKINHLSLLPVLYDEVLIPQAVYHETVITGQTRGYPDAKILQAFLTKMGWQPVEPDENVSGLETARLGRGEYEAIALEELLITIEDREDIWIHPDLCRFVRREVLRK